jgi:hemoglobin
MKRDIETTADIEMLVNEFYEKVKADATIGPFFQHVNWQEHLPVMYQFWQNAIFYSGGYNGNPLKTHQGLHKAFPLSKEHFEVWINLFTGTVDELYEGEKAALAKQRAISIATVMQIKIC